MRVKLISFSESKLVAMNVSHSVIAEKVKEITGIEEGFLFCQTQKEMFSGVKNGVETADVIVLAVDVSRFISTKAALFRALGFKCRLNSEITNLINSDHCMATLNENQVKAHAAIPVGGEAFVTSDGLFSGFGIEAGKQKMIFVPIDEKRIGSILENGMIAFLSKGVEKVIPQEEAVQTDIPEEMEGYVEPIENFEQPQTTDELVGEQYEEIYRAPVEVPVAEVPVAEVSAVEETSDSSFVDISSSSLSADLPEESVPMTIDNRTAYTGFFASMLNGLEAKGLKIAVVRHKENEIYTELIKNIENSSAVIVVDRAMEDYPAEDAERKEMLASVAKNALRGIDAHFAVAMTDVFVSEDDVSYIFAAVSDGNRASVYKIYSSEEDEGLEELYRAGLEGIFSRLETKLVVPQQMVVPEAAPMGNIAPSSKGKMTISTQILIWVLVIVALCALAALIIDAVMAQGGNLSEMTSSYITEIGNLLSR